MIAFPNAMDESTDSKPLPLELDNSLSYWELVNKVIQMCNELLALEKQLDITLKDYTSSMKNTVELGLSETKINVNSTTADAVESIQTQISATRNNLKNALDALETHVSSMIVSVKTELNGLADTSAVAIRTKKESYKSDITTDIESVHDILQEVITACDSTISTSEKDYPQKISSFQSNFTKKLNNFKSNIADTIIAILSGDVYDSINHSIKFSDS